MDRAELRELWENNKDRPVFVREHRDAIHEHTDTEERIPDKSPFHVRQWLSDHGDTVTAQLAGVEGDECTETTGDGEVCGRDLPCQYHGLESASLDAATEEEA